ncbi:hypothetical protein N3Z16_03670 [Candidatus Megaera polyxenophila]|jgi:hypothetical protein|nr:hypothetical protein N3Z16_03670 [Candidatus Megaera polyxenophila]
MIAENLSDGWYEDYADNRKSGGRKDIAIKLYLCVYKSDIYLD